MSTPPYPRGAEGATAPPRPARVRLPAAAVPGWCALAIVALAALAALALPGRPAGLGLALVGGGLCAVSAAASPRCGWFATGCWVAAAALAAVPAVRAAGWVVVLALLAAFVLAAVAAAGARTWRELARAVAGATAALVPGSVVVVAAATRRAGVRGWTWLRPAARGALIAAILLAVFVPLLVAADAAFAELVDGLRGLDPGLDRPAARIGAGVLALGVGGALLLAGLRSATHPPAPARRRLGRVEVAIGLGALDVTFAVFVAIQLATLFGGHEHVLGTAGLTYAEYARSDFFQLAAVAALTLAVVAAVARWAPGDRLTRALLAVLCAFALVVLASALRRLGLYEDAFGATRLRLLVHVALLWLGAVFALVLLAGGLRDGARLPRAIVVVSAATVLGFVAIDPDARIAERNVDRYLETGRLDRATLARLSADAAPAIARLPAPLAACVAADLRVALAAPDGLAGANLARGRARVRLGGLPRC